MNLPSDYRLLSRLDLTSRKKTLQLGVFNILALIVFGGLFLYVGTFIRRDFGIARLFQRLSGMYGTHLVALALALLAILFVMVCLHEATHGLFMWAFTRKRPHFGFKVHPYAALPPNTYASRNQGIFISLTPLIIISLVGMPVLLLFPVSHLWIPIAFLSFNGAASVGDILLVGWLLKYHSNVLWGADNTSNVVYGSGKS